MTAIKDRADWVSSHGVWLTVQEHLGEVDRIAEDCEKRWGVGVLRTLVDLPLREKFDRQRAKLNHAIWNGPLQTLIDEARRMGVAWRALDAAAQADGLWQGPPDHWEHALAGGAVLVLLRTEADAVAYRPKRPGARLEVVWSLPEVARLLGDRASQINAIKAQFPGATVEGLRPFAVLKDPVTAIDGELDDPIPF